MFSMLSWAARAELSVEQRRPRATSVATLFEFLIDYFIFISFVLVILNA